MTEIQQQFIRLVLQLTHRSHNIHLQFEYSENMFSKVISTLVTCLFLRSACANSINQKEYDSIKQNLQMLIDANKPYERPRGNDDPVVRKYFFYII